MSYALHPRRLLARFSRCRSLIRQCAWVGILAAGIVPATICASVLPRVALHGTAGAHAHGAPMPLPAWHRTNNAAALDMTRLLPVNSVRITSGFGRRRDPLHRGGEFHSGVDFAGRVGTPVHAVGDGVVIDASFHRDYGNVVVIDHGQGCVTLYAHNSRLEVSRGETVLAGQEIARMGSTGHSTGSHLHFEVRHDGARIDPQGALAAQLLRGTAAPEPCASAPRARLSDSALEPGLDGALDLHRHGIAATIQRLAHRQAHPSLADAVLLDVAALHAVETQADAAFERGFVVMRAARVVGEAVGRGIGHLRVHRVGGRRAAGAQGYVREPAMDAVT